MFTRLLFCTLLFAGLSFAQSTTTGTLDGTVTDPSDAVVAGVKITVTNTGTGRITETVSGDRGQDQMPLLPPGVYDLKFEKAGFNVQHHKAVVVTVGEWVVVDAKLSVSGSTQLIEVFGESPLIETERTQQS